MINIYKSILCVAILISTIHISCGANFDHKDNDPSVDETENAKGDLSMSQSAKFLKLQNKLLKTIIEI